MIYEGKIGSLRRFKDDVSEVKSGFECGIGFDKFNDLKVGDVIEVFAMERVLTPGRRRDVGRKKCNFELQLLFVLSSNFMSQGSRPDRVADQIRGEVASMLARDVHDPGIGFVTITRVQVTPDLQHARIHYTALGDDKARANTAKALGRAAAVPAPPDRLAAAAASACPSSSSTTTSRSPARIGSSSCSTTSAPAAPAVAVSPDTAPDDDDQS